MNEQSLVEGVVELERVASAGSADAALAIARRLLENAEGEQPATGAVAEAVNSLGLFFSRRAFDAEARRALDRALALLQASGARDDTLLASIHNNLGQLDERAGDLAAAERHLEQALALHRGSTAHPIAVAYSADNLGAVLLRLGKLDRAEALMREALGTLERAGPKYLVDVATALGNLGSLYHRRGEFARAKAYLARSIDTHLRARSLEEGDARIPIAHLIELAINTGDERLADELIDLLLRIGGAKIGAAHHPIAIILLELASRAFDRFALGLADRLATRARAILEVTAGDAAPPTLRALQLLGNVHAAKGNTDTAEQELLRALSAPGHDAQRKAELLIDFGKTLRARGRGAAQPAIGTFERALALLRAQGAAKPLLASALGNLALVHFDNDDAARAEALYREALALGDARAIGGEYPWLLYSLALLHYHVARHDEARAGMTRALRLWTRQRGATHPFVATAHANLALVHWARGDLAAAQRHFERAATLQAKEMQRILLIGTERQRLEAARGEQGELFKRVSFCFHAGARSAAAHSAAQLLLQRKGCVLDAMALTHARLRERLDADARERFDQLVELRRRISELALSAQLFGDTVGAGELARLQADEDRLEAELSHAGALGAGALAPVTLDSVRAALPAHAVLIDYLRWTAFDPQRTGRGSPWRGERYAAMVLRARGAPRWFDLGDAATIDAAVEALRALLRDPDSDPDAVRAASQAMHQKLVAPLARLLRGPRLIYVAPDGQLNLLPFASLGAPMVGERRVVCHLASGRDLARAHEPAAADAPVQVIVDPNFDADGDGAVAEPTLRLATLPGTRAEADALRALFPDCRVASGADASTAALKAVARPALLHVATHGVFSPPSQPGAPLRRLDVLPVDEALLVVQRPAPAPEDDPMLRAGLALAGANRSAPGAPRGFVSAAEIASLDLRGTELVVLTACDTGLGVAAHGEEFAGLRRALAIAGAASQVISLWEVEDDAAAVLIGEFYRRLAAGAGRAEALQQAQHSVRRRPRFAHPSAWAGFVAWGAAAPLSDGLRARARQP